MPTQNEIESLVLATIRDLNRDWQLDTLRDPRAETPLWGESGGLDSMGLVILIAELEARINEQYGCAVVLADDAAMSRTRSPFRRVDMLCAFCRSALKEREANE